MTNDKFYQFFEKIINEWTYYEYFLAKIIGAGIFVF